MGASRIPGSVRKLAGAGNLSESALGLGCVTVLCSELGSRDALQGTTAAEWEYPQGAGALN